MNNDLIDNYRWRDIRSAAWYLWSALGWTGGKRGEMIGGPLSEEALSNLKHIEERAQALRDYHARAIEESKKEPA